MMRLKFYGGGSVDKGPDPALEEKKRRREAAERLRAAESARTGKANATVAGRSILSTGVVPTTGTLGAKDLFGG